MARVLLLIAFIVAGFQVKALDLDASFESIDGGTLTLSQWDGQTVLVVNTASRCGYTYQYSGLQTLYDSYRARGLVVLAVPSNDFEQELASNAEVQDFCDLQYGIDMPMTGLSHVKGPQAHPFFKSLKEETGFVPNWNFNKVLIAPDGKVIATYRASIKPNSLRLLRDLERVLK